MFLETRSKTGFVVNYHISDENTNCQNHHRIMKIYSPQSIYLTDPYLQQPLNVTSLNILNKSLVVCTIKLTKVSSILWDGTEECVSHA